LSLIQVARRLGFIPQKGRDSVNPDLEQRGIAPHSCHLNAVSAGLTGL